MILQSNNRLLVDSVHLEFDRLQVLQSAFITDDLFLLRDGYTFPIKSREDLIHHGYILR